jgi:hypothetical protein
MHINCDRSATVPLGRPSRDLVTLTDANADRLGADEVREHVGLEPGMLRKLLPWVVAPWVVIALVVCAL